MKRVFSGFSHSLRGLKSLYTSAWAEKAQLFGGGLVVGSALTTAIEISRPSEVEIPTQDISKKPQPLVHNQSGVLSHNQIHLHIGIGSERGYTPPKI
jgi:urease accessory protein UreH